MKLLKGTSKMIGGLLLAAATVMIFVIYGGWAVMTLWNWFIPITFGLSELTLGQATGIDLLISLMTAKVTTYGSIKKLTEVERLKMLGKMTYIPITTVGIGYLVLLLFF